MKATLFFVLAMALVWVPAVWGADPNALEVVDDPAVVDSSVFAFLEDYPLGLEIKSLMNSKTVEAAVMVWPAKNDVGIGVMGLGGDWIEADNFAAGPAAEVKTGEIYETALKAIVPDAWVQFVGDATAEVEPFALVAGLWDTRTGDEVFIGGIGFRLFPDSNIQPVILNQFTDASNAADWENVPNGWEWSIGVIVTIW